MGQLQTSPAKPSHQSSRTYPVTNMLMPKLSAPQIAHEGLLKLQTVPFKNCIQINAPTGALFLQHIDLSLRDLLQPRLYTNKLFPVQDVQRMIENIVYTLAYLQQHRIPYKDICAQNIYYHDGAFKLLPDQLIAETRYQRFVRRAELGGQRGRENGTREGEHGLGGFVTLSPEMIIAYRCKEISIGDADILDRSNVFCLGILFMEVMTLLPAHQCYDTHTSDILDQVITQRIQLIKQYYSQEIASIVANMLDYDYAQRMSLKEVSIFVNRQLNKQIIQNTKISKQLSNKKSQVIKQSTSTYQNAQEAQNSSKLSHSKSVLICKHEVQNPDEGQSRISKPSQVGSTSEKKKSKTNQIYINGSSEQHRQDQSTFARQDRNKIYMKSSAINDKKLYINQNQQNQRSSTALRQISNNDHNVASSGRFRETSGKLFNVKNARQQTYRQKQNPHRINIDLNNKQDQNNYSGSQFSKDYAKRKNSTDYLGYRVQNNKASKDQLQNHLRLQGKQYDYKPQHFQQSNIHLKQNKNSIDYGYKRKEGTFLQKFTQLQQFSQDSGSRGYFNGQKANPNNNSQQKDQDHSLSRIKCQIQRSRKLIQQFKKCQKPHY